MIPLLLVLTFLTLLSLDLFTLNLLAPLFQHQVQIVQNEPMKLNLFSAGLCYLLLGVGLYTFIISKKQSVWQAFLLGILVYGVYELTTKSLLRKWMWRTVIIDTLWGGILFALTTWIVYQLKKRFL